MAIRVSWGIWNPHFGGRVGRRGSTMALFERAIVVSYRLSIVTVALSVTIRPQFCDRMSPTLKSTGGGSLWAQIPGCFLGIDLLMFGSAQSEHPRLNNGDIISEEFQPMWSQSTNVRPSLHADRQTDDMRSQDRALHYSVPRGNKNKT